MRLPALDVTKYTPALPLEATTERFVSAEETALAPAMAAIESVARTISLDPSNPANDASKHLLSCLSAVSQLSGWQHVQNYIDNPKLYQEQTKSAQRGEEFQATTRKPLTKGSMDDFQLRGQVLIKRLCQRIEWLLEMQRLAEQPFDAVLCVRLIGADQEWAAAASVFMKEAEAKVTDMLASNQIPFQGFRQLQRKGVQWPHSPELRHEIERAGFVFRPMMIKRDRYVSSSSSSSFSFSSPIISDVSVYLYSCVCETCGVEVNGWRPWHNPWSFHNYARHPPTFQPGVRPFLLPGSSPQLSQMITFAFNAEKAQGNASGMGISHTDMKHSVAMNLIPTRNLIHTPSPSAASDSMSLSSFLNSPSSPAIGDSASTGSSATPAGGSGSAGRGVV